MDSIERIRAEPTRPGGKKPEDMSPQEIHSVLWQVLTFRDSGGLLPHFHVCYLIEWLIRVASVAKKIEKTIGRFDELSLLA